MKVQLAIANFEKQQTIFDCKTRYKTVPKGRRFGLTRGAANNFIKQALSRTFTKGLWVDTVNANIERYVERYFIPNLKKLPPNYWAWKKQQKILYIDKSYIDFRSVDNPENIEGFGYNLAFLNEAGIILKDEYLWNNAIRPMLWDYTCPTIIGGTPKGKGVFHELYLRGLDPDQKNYQSFKFSTFDNPFLPHAEILEEIKSMPERVVRQEIYAEFLDDTGVVFTGVGQITTLQPKEPEREHLYVIGCDLAKVQDYTVLTVYDRKDNHQVYQMRFNQLEWPFQKKKIKDLSMKYNRALVIMDTTGIGEPIFDDLSRDLVPVEGYKFTNESKKNLIEKMANWIELKNIYMLDLDETRNELNSFTYDITNRGNVIYQAPTGFHDDIVFSHSLAIWGLQPIPLVKREADMTVVARDVQEKLKGMLGEQDILEYEAV